MPRFDADGNFAQQPTKIFKAVKGDWVVSVKFPYERDEAESFGISLDERYDGDNDARWLAENGMLSSKRFAKTFSGSNPGELEKQAKAWAKSLSPEVPWLTRVDRELIQGRYAQ